MAVAEVVAVVAFAVASFVAAALICFELPFVIVQRGAIEGWDDGIRMFKKGGSGRLFIPSSLAYGARGAGADIKPNESLMFEIQVVDVIPAEQYKKQMEAQNRLMQQRQMMQQQMQQQQQPQQQPK